MIPELFLMAALSPRPTFVHADSQGAINAHRMITTRLESNPNQRDMIVNHIRLQLKNFPRHHNRLGLEGADFGNSLRIDGKILVIGGDPVHVRTMRQYDMNVFGALTQDFKGVTPYHAVANPGNVSFLSETFELVLWHHIWVLEPKKHVAWLHDAIRLVEEEGFFAFDQAMYPFWPKQLIEAGWTLITWPTNTLSYQLSIWKRPTAKTQPGKILFWPAKDSQWYSNHSILTSA